MRSEPGAGTLFSHVIGRPNVNVKLAGATVESNESKGPMSNGGGTYASLVGVMGPKLMLGGNILRQSTQLRWKEGSAAMIEQRPHSNAVELHSDLCSVERLKELRSRIDPLLLKSNTAHSPSFSLSSARAASLLAPPHEKNTVQTLSLPHWGLFKKARRSRFETVKAHGDVGALDKAILPRSSADESVDLTRLHAWTHASSVLAESDGHSSKGGTTAVTSRAAGTVCAGGGQGSTFRGGGKAASSHKSERCIFVPRHRSNGSGEANLASNHSNANNVSGGRGALAASAFLQAKNGRSEPESLEWPRILIGLSRKEKEDDFLILKGSNKLPQRPKKRPKVVERALHYCTPGNSLSDLSRGRYDVREKKSAKKRPRGLKAMESMESESD